MKPVAYDTLRIEYGRCPPDCRACEEACAKEKGANGTGLSRMKAVHAPRVGFHGALTCIQCSQPRCQQACPAGAIEKSEDSGLVLIDETRCVGCGLCMLACPYGGIYYDGQTQKTFKCDRCDGQPKCVEACPYGVLSWVKSRDLLPALGQDMLSPALRTCQGCGLEMGARFTFKVLGKCIVFNAPGCSSFIFTSFRGADWLPHRNSCYYCRMTNVPSSMSGFRRYFQKTGQDVPMVAFVGDGVMVDAGFQNLSSAAERGENIFLICADNQAYMNTGVQRSGSTPYGAWTTTTPVGPNAVGKAQPPKNVPLLLSFHHGTKYVATASVAFLDDYARKLAKAMTVKDGLAYIHLLVPCPTGWRAPIESTIELAASAVETNFFPLWEYERGEFRLTYQPKTVRPVSEFTSNQGRFSHLKEEGLAELQRVVDDEFALIERLTRLRK